MSSQIGTSCFSHEWLLEQLKSLDPKFSDVSEVKSVDEISGGKGFCSKVYLCNVGSEDVILKVPECGKLLGSNEDKEAEANDEKIKSVRDVHDRECMFYEDFGHSDLIQLPSVYQTGQFQERDQGYLLMNSLSKTGGLGELCDGFNKHQLLAMARDFAKFHAHFLTLEDKIWIKKYEKEVGESTIPVMEGLFKALKAMDEELFGEGVDKLLPFVGNRGFFNFVTWKAHRFCSIPAVLTHGNLWTNNIFWKLNGDGSISNEVEAYIDWQLAHSGSIMYDLASVLTICTEPDMRRLVTNDVLKEYYDTLTVEMQGNVPFKFDQVEKLYKMNFIAQCFNIMFTVVYHPHMNAKLPEDVREAQFHKIRYRAKFAMDDCLAILSTDLPSRFSHLST